MGKRSRSERKAKRKSKRSKKKIKKAEKLEKKGGTKNQRKAEKLKDKAAKLENKSREIQNQIAGGVIRGLSAKIVEVNSLGNIIIEANWNFQINELSSYEKLYLSIAPESPLRSSEWNREVNTEITSTKFKFGLTKNMRYRIKIAGYKSGIKKVLDSTYVKKYRN